MCTVLSNIVIGLLFCLLKLLQLFLFYSLFLLHVGIIFKSASMAAGTLEMSIAGALFDQSVAALMVFGRTRLIFAA